MTVQVAVRETAAERALARGWSLLLAQREPEGFWKAELETNVTMDAEDLLLRRVPRASAPPSARRGSSADWIRSQQRAGRRPGRPATAARPISRRRSRPTPRLRLAGDPPTTPRTSSARAGRARRAAASSARASSRASGSRSSESGAGTISRRCRRGDPAAARGSRSTSTTSRCWARQTIVPLTVVATHRPRRSARLRAGRARAPAPRGRRARSRSRPGRVGSSALDRALQRYERRPLGALRARCAPRRRRVDRPAPGGRTARGAASSRRGCTRSSRSQLLGYPLDHPVLRAASRVSTASRSIADGDAAARGAVNRRSGTPRSRWSRSPTPGLRAGHPRACSAARLARSAQEIRVRGDWAVRRPRARAERLGLRVRERQLPRHRRHGRGDPGAARGGHRDAAAACDAAIARASPGPSAMQCRDGGWAAFDADNTRRALHASCRSATSAR